MGPCDCHSSDEIWSHFWVALSLAGDATHSISIRGSSSAPSRCWVEKVQVKICWTFNYRFKRKAILLYFERDSQVCKFWVTFWLPSKRFEWKSRPRKKEKEKEGEKDRYREKEREREKARGRENDSFLKMFFWVRSEFGIIKRLKPLPRVLPVTMNNWRKANRLTHTRTYWRTLAQRSRSLRNI